MQVISRILAITIIIIIIFVGTVDRFVVTVYAPFEILPSGTAMFISTL